MKQYAKTAALVVASAAAMLAGPAFGAVDLTTDAAAIETDLVANITLIGSALIAGAVAAVVFKWAKGMIFG